MNLEQALQDVSRLGIDTAPLIYFVEKHLRFSIIMREILLKVDDGQVIGQSSVITLTEVLTLPKRHNDIVLENSYRDLLLHSRNFIIGWIDPDVAVLAAEYRAKYNIRTPDALQLASAFQSGCQAFLTNDNTLKRFEELRIIVLDELEI